MKGQAAHQKVNILQILKLLSLTGVLEYAQLLRMIRVPPELLDTLLTQMARDGKLIRQGTRIAADEKALENDSPGNRKCLWVFADFLDRTDYFTAGEFPSVICFFADGKEYEILYAEPGKENILNRAAGNAENPPGRVIVVEEDSQTERIRIPGVTAFCTVDDGGKVAYFRKKG